MNRLTRYFRSIRIDPEPVRQHFSLIVLGVVFVLSLSACGGSSNNDSDIDNTATTTLVGTVATGAPFVGTLSVTGSGGAQALNVAIAADGRYSADVTGLTPPYMLQAIPADPLQASLYSYAATANAIANVTQLTTLAMFMSNGNADLTSFYAAWASSAAAFAQQTLLNAQAIINANFAALYQANGLDAATYDFFTTTFAANNAGLDAVLDAVSVDLSGGNIAVAVAGNPGFSFDVTVDTSNINIGGNNDIAVSVDTGLTPVYSWDGGNVRSVTVSRLNGASPATVIWGVATQGADGIASPLTHGNLPSGAIQVNSAELVLTHGVAYQVSVARFSDNRLGSQEFIAAATVAPTYSVGGTISGATSKLVLQNSNGDSLSVTGTSFTFATALADGTSYNATVTTQPLNETCTVTNGSGTINGTDVNDIIVTCLPTGGGATYTVSGSVSGLTSAISLELQKNGSITGDLPGFSGGNFSFPATFDSGDNYAVLISAQPNGQNCTLTNGSGTIASADITNVTIDCSANSYAVGGIINGLSGSLSLELRENGVFADDLSVSASGATVSFSFNATLTSGSAYEVIIGSQPSGQVCSIASNGSGTSSANVTINCADSGNNNAANASLEVSPQPQYFDFSSGTVSSVSTNTDIRGVMNEGVNFGNGDAYDASRRIIRLAQSGSLNSVPTVPAWSDAAPWVVVTWDFTDGTQGQPLAVGEIWAVYTTEGNYAVMQITGLPGGNFGNSFTFDYLYNADGSRSF